MWPPVDVGASKRMVGRGCDGGWRRAEASDREGPEAGEGNPTPWLPVQASNGRGKKGGGASAAAVVCGGVDRRWLPAWLSRRERWNRGGGRAGEAMVISREEEQETVSGKANEMY